MKKWTEKYGESNDKVRAILFCHSAIESNMIEEEQEFAAYLLYCSVESRINSCHYGQGVYEGVHCDWDNAIVGCTDIITKKPDFWAEYVEMSKIFLENDQRLSYRPTIDRINEDPEIGYRLDNIAVLSHGDNARKALAKPHYVFEVDLLNDPFNLQANKSFRKYISKKEAVESLGLKFKTDTGRLFEANGKLYLIQSEAITLGQQEIEDYELEDENLYKVNIPIPVVDANGNRGIANIVATFPYMVIKLKDVEHPASN